MDDPTPEQPTGPTRPNLARALIANVRRSGEKSTVFSRIMAAGLVVLLAGGLAVGIGALALHGHAKSPKTTNAADRQLDPKKSATPSRVDPSRVDPSRVDPSRVGAPVPVPIAPPGKAARGTQKSTKQTKGSTQHQTTGEQSSGQPQQLYQASVQPVTIVSYASGKCIDVTKGQTGVPIEIWNCNPVTDLKRWTFYRDGTIRSQGHCMTVVGGSGNGAPIEVMPCTGGSAQRFNLNNAHDLVNIAADKCVDVKDKQTANGTRLQLWSCAGTSNQKWHT